MTRPFDPYDAQAFRSLGHQFVDRMADYLLSMEQAVPGDPQAPPVLTPLAPEALEREWDTHWEAIAPEDRESRALEFVDSVLSASNHPHHPGFIGHQVSAPLPFATLCEMLNAMLNNGMAVFEMGQLQTVFERHCIRWMAGKIGFDAGAGGLMTSGGSLGNLTALLAARQAKIGSWKAGSGEPLSVLVSADSHYCIARAMQVMGQGEAGVIRVPVDEHHRMRTELLPGLVEQAKSEGRRVFAVVSSSCSTSTGAFDGLNDIADFCERNELWLHVDGAHGASHLLSAKHAGPLDGIERSDSVVWDAHKMMLLPALVTAVVFRDDRHADQSFSQEADYLFEDAMARYDLGHRTLECTKRAMGLTLYAALHVYGEQIFADSVDCTVDLAQAFARLIDESDDFRLPLWPETNIVCFRYAPAGRSEESLDALQEQVRQSVLNSGAYYIVQTRLPAGIHLRTTLINPRTSLEDLEGLLSLVREIEKSSYGQ